jgi:hypothetical protein
VVDRSVHDQVVQPVQGAGAGEEPVLGPRDRPGSHAVPRRVRLQAAAAVGEDRPDHAGRHRHRPDHAGRRTTGRSPTRRCARLSRGPTRTRT